MLRAWLLTTAACLATAFHARANPYPDPAGAPLDLPLSFAELSPAAPLDAARLRAEAHPVLRVQVRWDGATDTFAVDSLEIERSGTDGLLAASRRDDPHGSFKGRLVDPDSGEIRAHGSIGTGVAYKHLVRALTFRFPLPEAPVRFELLAEDSETGVVEPALSVMLDPESFREAPVADVEARVLKAATSSPHLVVNVYAEGYAASARERFFREAARVASTLKASSFPLLDRFEIRAVFAPSSQRLGSARDLGRPVPERDSFLGLYFPYWYDFGRFYHVIYPTRELRYRRAIGAVPYDYPIALVDDASYWGVGNFKELTAVPAGNGSFSYLLLHEFGHYFGLNEEYEGGGPTELAFAPGADEPWSQNITFQRRRDLIKWNELIDAATPVPTPRGGWRSRRYGAYAGGYGDTPHEGDVFKPGMGCTMESGRAFCEVCRKALEHRIRFDLGE